MYSNTGTVVVDSLLTVISTRRPRGVPKTRAMRGNPPINFVFPTPREVAGPHARGFLLQINNQTLDFPLTREVTSFKQFFFSPPDQQSNPRFSPFGQIPGYFQNHAFFHLDDVNGQISNSAWTNLEFCMDKSRILHGQISNSAWTNP